MSRVAIIRVSKEMLAEMLFPWGTHIHQIREPRDVWQPDCLEFVVEHHSLAEIQEGETMPIRLAVAEKIERRFE